MTNVDSLPCAVDAINNWKGFAIFMAATLWLSAIGVAAFYVRAYITRIEGKKAAPKRKATAAGAGDHTHHGPNGHARD